MMLAWFSSSERMRTPGPPSVQSTPRLAANPVGKVTAASVPFQSASSRSSSLWTGRLPVTRRDAPEPAPQRARAALARPPPRPDARSSRDSRWTRRRPPARPRAGPWGRGRRTPGAPASGPRRRPEPARPGCGRPRGCRRHVGRTRRRCGAGAGAGGGARCRRQRSVARPARSSSPPTRASTIRTISSAVIVSGGMSTTTSPSGRNSTPRPTAPAQTRRPQRNPGEGGANSTPTISPRWRISRTSARSANRSRQQ